MYNPISQIQILATKPKSIQNVVLGADHVFSPEIQNLIELGWAERVKEFEKNSKPYFNSSLKQFEKLEIDEIGHVSIATSEQLTYKDVVGLRFWDYSVFEKYQTQPLPIALSTHCITITSDNYIVLRARTSGDWGNCYDIQGGFLRLEDQDILQRQQKFITSDLGIVLEQIQTLTPLYIYRNRPICEVQCLYLAQLEIDSLSLKEMTHGKIKLRFCAADKVDLANFSKMHTLHPPSSLALQLHFS